ncbi:MAG TPA: 3-phosphoshikimate 1-carboxyvinyltransferase [Polyangiaceae bacterium]|nr:3-phosphoshikimate 1-carboxyvinyltransferase [Polyangiaceae bacterium]
MAKSAPLSLVPLSKAPDLVWRVPGSKSITNRALILAALSEGVTELSGVLESDDTRHMRAALTALGIQIEGSGTEWRVWGGRSRLRPAKEPLFVGNSGTTVRFLAALCALVDGETTLYGDAAMSRRPIAVLVDGLRALGVRVECETGCPPLKIHGGRLRGGRVQMQGELSSQYFSALLMAAAGAEADVEVEVLGTLVSRPYVDITLRMMRDFGGSAEAGADSFRVHARGGYSARNYQVEPDASAASYPFALAAASGGRIEVPGLGTQALQGDYAFVDILERAGARVERFADRTIVQGPPTLSGVDVDMRDVSDTVMTLAAIAPICRGATRIRNIANIRLKETDRLAATAAELERLGQAVQTGEDWLFVEPAPLQAALVHTYDDHRMAMSFAILGAVRSGVQIEDPACVAKTYPRFFEDLGQAYLSVGDRVPWQRG